MARRLAMIVVYLLVSLPRVTWAEDPRITDVIVTNTRDDLILYFRVEGCFTEELEQAIMNGVPTTFTFLVALNQVRNFWMDKNLAEMEIQHTVKFNNLKDEFVITRNENGKQPIVVNSFSEAKRIMAEVENLSVIQLDKLERDHLYQVRIKAELKKITLPLYLHYAFRFFLFLWDFETDWYATDFIY